MRNPTVPNKIDIQPLDKALQDIGIGLQERLPWLDNAFGKVERLVKMLDKREIKYPAIYVGSNRGEDYLSMLPDRHLGNYLYCDITSEEVDHKPRQSRDGVVELDLVFHWNYKKVYPADHRGRTIENVKQDIFDALDKPITGIRLRVLGFEEGANNIYNRYTHREIDQQMLMRPYGGVKIKIRLYYEQNC
jgi:hypothetical protein